MITLLLVGLGALLLPQSSFADFGLGWPTYLFTDWRYWLFVSMYVLLTVKIVRWTAQASPSHTPSFPTQDVSRVATGIFGVALVYQILHHTEHVTQIFQWWYMGLPPTVSKGIIFFADLEWNHFTFDMGYFIMLFVATVIFVRSWWQSGHKLGRVGAFLFISMNLVQGWHAVEHTYRITNHIKTGCSPCPGIVDQLTGVPLIPLHFWYNVLALTFPLMVYVWFGMHRKTWQYLRRKFARKGTAMYAGAGA